MLKPVYTFSFVFIIETDYFYNALVFLINYSYKHLHVSNFMWVVFLVKLYTYIHNYLRDQATELCVEHSKHYPLLTDRNWAYHRELE